MTHIIKIQSLLISIICVIETFRFTTWASNTTSIYDALRSHGLPIGLFPSDVHNFTLSEDGKFHVHLDEACNAKFESELHYDRNVSGQLSFGRIRNVSGISAQDLFLWFPVKGIRVDVPSSGVIYFDVGVVFKQFPLSIFESPPDCVAASQPLDLHEHRVDGLIKKLTGNLGYRFDQGKNARDIM